MKKQLKYPLLPSTKEDWRTCSNCGASQWAEFFLSKYSPNGTFLDWHGDRGRICLKCRSYYYNHYPAMEQVLELEAEKKGL